MKILLCNISDCAAHYIHNHFSDATFHEASSVDDLSDLSDHAFDLIVLGSPEDGSPINDHLHAISHFKALPASLTFISSSEVYSPDAGENIDENTPTHPNSPQGINALRDEKEVTQWEAASGIPVVILRVATIFGEKMSGWPLDMFKDVINGRYLHVRDMDGKISLLSALDLASAVDITRGLSGVFNVCDDAPSSWLQLAEAMSANAGARKRMTTLPYKWAILAYRYLRFIPAVKRSFAPDVLERRSMTCVLSAHKLMQATPWHPFNTLSVIAREENNYPYEEI